MAKLNTSPAVRRLARDAADATKNPPAIGTGEEPRAFPIFEEVPPGHFLMKIEGTAYEPHICDGEWAVVDAADRAIVFGELYAVLQWEGPHLWQISRITGFKVAHPDRCAYLGPLNHGRLPNINMSAGPMRLEYLEKDILGRVVGIIDPRERGEKNLRAAMLRRAEEERDEEEARKRRGPGGVR